MSFSTFLRANPMAVFGLALLATLLFAVAFGPLLYDVSPTRLNILRRLTPPSSLHWLGTDSLGRDVLARVLHGGRITLAIGIGVVALAFAIGVTAGLAAGYVGGWVDTAVMRFADAMLSFPSLVLAIALAAAFGPSLENAMLAVAITLAPQFARVARRRPSALPSNPMSLQPSRSGSPGDVSCFATFSPMALGRSSCRQRWRSARRSCKPRASASWAWAHSHRRRNGALMSRSTWSSCAEPPGSRWRRAWASCSL